MANPYRTHTCNDLRFSHAGQAVRLAGWIHNKRDLGGVLFIDLRDHYGVTQIVIPPAAAFQNELAHLPKETVISVRGQVRPRPEGTVNPALATGEVELDVASYERLGACESLPMNVFPEDHTPEETRLRYRFLDLRRSGLHQTIMLRAKVISSIRRRMIELGFQEFQTPILTSSSPEGARDFLVPSRLYPGEFYALPQAPQQFKQLLMVSGFDRYFQIAPCFRDEDGRADRTPGEFYQLDVEMSFVTQDDVFAAMEKLFVPLFQEFKPEWPLNANADGSFQRLTYKETMLKYGTDKPDLRIPIEVKDLTPLFAQSEFKAFAGKTVRAMAVPQAFDQPRSWFDNLQEEAKKLGAPGLAYVKMTKKEPAMNSQGEQMGWQQNVELSGPIAKFMMQQAVLEAITKLGQGIDNVIFFSADANETKAAKVLGAMRVKIAGDLGLIEKDVFKFTWIVDYPMYEYNEETKAVEFSHNPFSMPQGGLEALEKQDPLAIFAYQYDLVCNGYELASGAIRNHVPGIMYKAFAIAEYDQSVVDSKFPGMINAFRYGAPPHGGIAPGIDRIVMLLANETNIREVIAFPMAQNGRDLLMNAPSPASEKQLREVHLIIRKPPPKS
ncbi:MAG TPA: aspartate--tRNA ligase [Candidatus Methylacidiphilales bacterium]|nr:aspartate--tRNA ligase [Candidatus Methylacidiphilales bacterium]